MTNRNWKQPISDRTVTILRDTIKEIPELWMEVYIGPGPESERQPFKEYFAKARCTEAIKPEDADLVVFVGGADVNPAMYGAEKHYSTHFSTDRDKADMKLYSQCYEEGIPMLGVCRGAQLLYVMKGGKLYQDVDGHNSCHSMWDAVNRRVIHRVSSVHHQMVVPDRKLGYEILGDSSAASKRSLDNSRHDDGHKQDIEAFFFRDVCALGIQGHPEYKGFYEFSGWSYEMIQKYILENPDIDLIDNVRRLKPEIRAEREAARKDIIEHSKEYN